MPLRPPSVADNKRIAPRFAWDLDDATIFASVPEECLAVYLLYLGHWPYGQALFELEPSKVAAIMRVLAATIPARDKDIGALLKIAQELKASKV